MLAHTADQQPTTLVTHLAGLAAPEVHMSTGQARTSRGWGLHGGQAQVPEGTDQKQVTGVKSMKPGRLVTCSVHPSPFSDHFPLVLELASFAGPTTYWPWPGPSVAGL
jgi:hypothetical protein